MKKALAVSLLIPFLAAGGQNVLIGHNRQVGAAGCVAPAVTNRVAAYNPSNICTGGCSNGNNLSTLADFIGSRSMTGNGTYTTGVLTQPVVYIPGGTNGYSYTVTPLVGTYYMIAESACPSSSLCVLGAGSNGAQSLEWRINTTTNEIEVLGQGQPLLVTTSSGGGVVGVWHLFILTYDSSNNIVVKQCNSGSCTTIGTGNAGAHVPGGGQFTMGLHAGIEPSFTGYVAEWGYSTSSSFSATTLATWVQCKYGV